MHVNLIFRKKVPEYFSIENVFSIISDPLNKMVSTTSHWAVTNFADPLSVAKNILFFRKLRGDVFHVTGDIHYAVFAFPSNKVVLTIHDAVFLYNKTGIRKMIFQWIWLKLPVKYAKYITTISEASKKDIITNTGCPPSKVIVIPNPRDEAFEFSAGRFRDERPVILQMGTWSNKNLERVVKSLSGLTCHLKIIGKLSQDQRTLLIDSGIEFSDHFHLSKKELIAQYRSCHMVVFASTFEGFGLPILEAQSIGRPLVTSNIPPMSEVAGEGACLVDPFDYQSIRSGILRVMNEPGYREALVKKGLENIKRYNPEVIAGKYTDVYFKVTGKKQQLIAV